MSAQLPDVGTSRQFSLKVETSGAAARLDRLLSKATGLSRSRIKQTILAGGCRVDGVVCAVPDCKPGQGSLIELLVADSGSTLVPEAGELPVIWHDETMAVVNKPAGLTVHPCPSCPEGTLVHRLLARFPALSALEGFRPGIVHRLDKDTSGLLAVALDDPTRIALSDAFARREVHKTYLALCKGVPPSPGTSDLPLGRHPTSKTRRAVVPENRGGKAAHTMWEILYKDPQERFALLAVTILTGRTHQIRVHLAEAGYPLWGDALYGGASVTIPHGITTTPSRHLLHAWKLSLAHPWTGDRLAFRLPPPADFPATILALSRRLRRVVLTGTPGSGKSAVMEILRTQGIPVWSADACVDALYQPGGDGWLMLRGRYGHRFVPEDSAPVDRAALTAALIHAPHLRPEVEGMIHPMVFQAMNKFFADQEAGGAPLAVAEVPLWFETQAAMGTSRTDSVAVALAPPLVVTVTAPEAVRHARLKESRGWPEEKIAATEAWQWPEAAKVRAAQYAVDNSGSLDNLRREVDVFLESLQARAQAEEEALRTRLETLWNEA